MEKGLSIPFVMQDKAITALPTLKTWITLLIVGRYKNKNRSSENQVNFKRVEVHLVYLTYGYKKNGDVTRLRTYITWVLDTKSFASSHDLFFLIVVGLPTYTGKMF